MPKAVIGSTLNPTGGETAQQNIQLRMGSQRRRDGRLAGIMENRGIYAPNRRQAGMQISADYRAMQGRATSTQGAVEALST
jgi:hypothetical protein